MMKVLFFTMYDNICLGSRLLSSIAKMQGIETHLIIFKDQKTRAILKDSKDHLSYQFYAGGIKHGSCYAAYDYTVKEVKLLYDLLYQIKPDLICLSTRSFGYTACKKIFGDLKNDLKIPIIGGGWGPTLEPIKFLEFCDYVCFGEGEKTFLEICHILKRGSIDFDKVPNLIFFKNGNLYSNSVYPPLTEAELDGLPFPDFDETNKYLIDKNRVLFGKDSVNMKIYNCLAGRGCPMSCSYCMSSKYKALYNEKGFNPKKYRIRSVEKVIAELKMAKDKGAVYIRISDEIFPIYKEWVEKFIGLYKQHIDLPFFAYIRPEFHDDTTIKRLIDIGLSSSVVAIQSGSYFIRREIFKRFLPKERIISFAETLKQYKIEFTYHLINFNPFEREEHMIETLKLLYSLPFSMLIIFKLVPFPATPLSKMIDEQRPVALPDNVQKWYGYLYTMAVHSKTFRKLSKFIHEKRFFKKRPWILGLFFVPNFIVIHLKKVIRKLRYGSYTLLPIPITHKGHEHQRRHASVFKWRNR